MATYQVHFWANPTQWPSDPKQLLALWEQTAQAVDALVETGAMQPPQYITASEGYVRLDADSKSAAIALVAPFFPNWSTDIDELVPWDQAKKAILGAARQVASA